MIFLTPSFLFFSISDDEYELISGSTDKTVIVWQRKTTEDYQVCGVYPILLFFILDQFIDFF